ncbi:MAG TPA: bifunctional demethylmenaquinone methyltransferase/2-methoxy-6-polyprenyl-1,4-benzoquinol methylase UbiE [Nitrospiria bacterium]|nr:bifunctional demethylmenaquinone methyltransferase/2-methoxy-6-polyprenyl-1,4-benzoquinol methylase UbiE [Nitrospiria bacterium]
MATTFQAGGPGRERQVQAMFSAIAPRYDLNNTLLSFGLHHRWKRAAIDAAALKPGDRLLDLCAGTGDLAFLAARRVGGNGLVIASDLNRAMLEVGRRRAGRLGLDQRVRFIQGHAESIQLADRSVDAVTVAFGIRNVDHPDRAFAEIFRVLIPGGRLVCLEFSRPVSGWLRRCYGFYSSTLLPLIGTTVARDRTGVYRYLPASIREFPDQARLAAMIEAAGFSPVRYTNLAGGIVAIHVGVRPVDTTSASPTSPPPRGRGKEEPSVLIGSRSS